MKNDSLATVNDERTALADALEERKGLADALDSRISKMPTRRPTSGTQLGVIPKTVEEAITIAKAFALSGLYPDIKNAGMALAKILMGAEFGFGPAASMNAFHIVKGKAQMSGVSIATLIKKHAHYSYKILDHSITKCSIGFYEDGEELGIETFDVTDAKRQGTGAPTQYDAGMLAKFPKIMLFNRAMSNGAKFHCPDIFGGQAIYSEGEIEDAEYTTIPEANSVGDSVRQALESRIHKDAPTEPEITEADFEESPDEATDPTSEEEPASEGEQGALL